MNNFDDDLRLALRERASGVSFPADLSGAAIRRARSIRRRRRIGGAVAAVALVAVGVPAGLQVSDSLSRGDQQIAPVEQDDRGAPDDGGDGDDRGGDIVSSTVNVDLAELEEGDPPLVPHVDGSELVVDGDRLDLGVPAQQLSYVVHAGGEAWYTVGDDMGNLSLQTTGADLSLPVSQGPWASPDGRYVAWLAGGEVTVLDTASGDEATLAVGDVAHLQVVTFVGDELFVVPGDNRRTLLRWRIGDDDATALDGFVRPTAVSPDGSLVADMVSIDDYGSCTQVKELDGTPVGPRTCDFRIQGFSADGTYAYGSSSYGDGYADTFKVVLNVADGEVLMRINGPADDPDGSRQVSFMQATFETEAALVMLLEQGRNAALVRCDPATGECTRVSELAGGVEPYAADAPFRLTA
jgi:hypothetical protein